MFNLSLSFLSLLSALASGPVTKIADCNDSAIDLHSVEIGFKCRTSKGTIFERVERNNFGEAWKGPGDLIWSDFIDRNTQFEALTICKELGGKLPSRADFERGEVNGFREVIPYMEDRSFWSSTLLRNGPPLYAFLFSVFNGKGELGSANRDAYAYVRCVGR